jgi:hypothetical protein
MFSRSTFLFNVKIFFNPLIFLLKNIPQGSLQDNNKKMKIWHDNGNLISTSCFHHGKNDNKTKNERGGTMEKFTGSMNENVKKIKMESKVDLNEDLLLFEELDVSGYRAVIPGALECIICAATGWVCP